MSCPRVLFALLMIGSGARAAAGLQLPPSVEFRVPKPPTVAVVGDTLGSLGYELHVTNLSPLALTLKRIDVVQEGNGLVLLSLTDSALLRTLLRPGTSIALAERARLTGKARVLSFLWVPVDRTRPPAALKHRLTFGRDSAADLILEGATTPVGGDAVVISAPLRGEWAAINGPANTSGHRRAVLGLNGLVTVPQRYAIDFLQVDQNGQTFRKDRSVNENFLAQGQEALAVADATVVDIKDGIPENKPGGRAVPITLETIGGNYIVLDLGQSRFAFYAHLKPGSLRVKVGDRVRRGQVIGLVGNSGNSTEPHLHFHISDGLAKGTTTLGSEGLPYLIDRMDVVGECAITVAITCTRKAPVTVRNVMPSQNQLVRLTPPPGPPDYTAPADAPYVAEEVTVSTPMGHTLAGTLFLPRGASRTRPVGAIVTITGSGQQDRDESLPGLEGYRPFRQIADSLARRGIASLRMDDRGTWGSRGTFRGSTSADFAEDIRAGLAYLRTRPEINSKRLGLVGHSEGALIAPIVATKEPDLRALVLLAGVSTNGREVLQFQLGNNIDHNERFTPQQKDSARLRINEQIDTLAARDPWMKYFIEQDPVAVARTVRQPSVLILTGENDQQALPRYVAPWAAAFKAGSNKDVTARVIPGVNHLFVKDADGYPGGYTRLPPPVRIEPYIVGEIVDWLVRRLR